MATRTSRRPLALLVLALLLVPASSAAEATRTLRVRITSPRDRAAVRTGMLLVRGTVEAGGAEVGVTVNGMPAAVQGTAFAALLPVASDATSLTALATTAAGLTASHTLAVAVTGTFDEALDLKASPPGGAAPLRVSFAISGLLVPKAVELDANGDGTIDFTGASLRGQSFTFAAPGLYFPTATVADAAGTRRTVTGLVEVYDVAGLDSRLQAQWTGLKDALRAGDVARALTFIHSESREAYRRHYLALSATTLARIDQFMTTIRLIEVGPGGAQYEMLRTRDGRLMSFAVWFQIDDDGIWRLRRF